MTATAQAAAAVSGAAKVAVLKCVSVSVSAVASVSVTAVTVTPQVLGATVQPASDHAGFIDTLMLGSFWAGALLQVLIAVGTVGFAYWLFMQGRWDDRTERKEEAKRNVAKFLDLIFIVRSEIEDGKLATQKGVIATPADFLNRDILDDMMAVWTLLSDDSQKALIEARAKMRNFRGHQIYRNSKHMEESLEDLNGDLGVCATELQKDLAKLGKVVIV
jgi:hypothetical protein